jgi:hypothetical protein
MINNCVPATTATRTVRRVVPAQQQYVSTSSGLGSGYSTLTSTSSGGFGLGRTRFGSKLAPYSAGSASMAYGGYGAGK